MEIVRITYLWKKAVATTQKYILQIRENIQLKDSQENKKQWIRIVYYNINQLLTALFGI